MIGKLINNILDKILPDVIGDIIGAAVDGITGNYLGAATNALDAVEDVFEAVGADGAQEFTQDLLGYAGAGASLVSGSA